MLVSQQFQHVNLIWDIYFVFWDWRLQEAATFYLVMCVFRILLHELDEYLTVNCWEGGDSMQFYVSVKINH